MDQFFSNKSTGICDLCGFVKDQCSCGGKQKTTQQKVFDASVKAQVEQIKEAIVAGYEKRILDLEKLIYSNRKLIEDPNSKEIKKMIDEADQIEENRIKEESPKTIIIPQEAAKTVSFPKPIDYYDPAESPVIKEAIRKHAVDVLYEPLCKATVTKCTKTSNGYLIELHLRIKE
jgi:hypothetical protein